MLSAKQVSEFVARPITSSSRPTKPSSTAARISAVSRPRCDDEIPPSAMLAQTQPRQQHGDDAGIREMHIGGTANRAGPELAKVGEELQQHLRVSRAATFGDRGE